MHETKFYLILQMPDQRYKDKELEKKIIDTALPDFSWLGSWPVFCRLKNAPWPVLSRQQPWPQIDRPRARDTLLDILYPCCDASANCEGQKTIIVLSLVSLNLIPPGRQFTIRLIEGLLIIMK